MAPATEGDFQPNTWVTIAADNTVSIISPASEMGQGIMTTLPLLIAEDMDADWNKVRIVQAPSDAKKYGNPGFYGVQLTGGSEIHARLLRAAAPDRRTDSQDHSGERSRHAEAFLWSELDDRAQQGRA